MGAFTYTHETFLNLAFALTAMSLGIRDGLQAVSVLLIAGAAAMPAVRATMSR